MSTDRWPLFEFFPTLRADCPVEGFAVEIPPLNGHPPNNSLNHHLNHPLNRDALNPVTLCQLPTVITHADTLSQYAWIKRDDTNAEQCGGNRMRKLEFILAEIRQRKARSLVMLCASESRAAIATAAICQKENLCCEVITFDQHAQQCPAEANRTHTQLHSYGAKVVPRKSFYLALMQWLLHPLRLRKDCYFLHAGSTQSAEVFAHINAALELAMQVDRGECPMPKNIIVAAASGATVAGISLGASLALPGCVIHAVQVAPSTLGPLDLCSAAAAHRLRQRTWDTLVKHAPALQPEPDDNLIWHSDYLGDGYGIATLKSRLATERGKRIGLGLNATCTGKAFAAFCDILAQTDETTLFWNTARHDNDFVERKVATGRPAATLLGSL